MAIIQVTDQTFEQEVLKSNKPVLVDFWAEWCGPCHVIAPILEQIATEQGDKLTIAKLNVDENPQSSEKYRIMSIPNMKIFKDGTIVDEIVGVQPKQVLESKISAHL